MRPGCGDDAGGGVPEGCDKLVVTDLLLEASRNISASTDSDATPPYQRPIGHLRRPHDARSDLGPPVDRVEDLQGVLKRF
jgi:hypothetical protein